MIVNCTRHGLTEDQMIELSAVYSLPFESIIEIEDLIDAELFYPLMSSPSKEEELRSLSIALFNFIKANALIAILPIGSPAFMFEFAQRVHEYRSTPNAPGPRFLFVHSERIRHVKFLEM